MVFVVMFVAGLLGYAANMMVQLPFMVVQQVVLMRQVMGGGRPDPARMMQTMMLLQVPSQVLTALVNAAVHLYSSFGLALLFFDVRQRKEGLDLEVAVARLAASRGTAPPPA